MRYRVKIEIDIETTAKDSPQEREQITKAVAAAINGREVTQRFNSSNGATRISGYLIKGATVIA